MRYVFILLLFFISSEASAFSRPLSKSIDSVVVAFDRALMAKDTATLRVLLDDNVEYGHSNGWVEMKGEVINDLYNGKLTYKKINPNQATVVRYGNVVTVRMKSDVDVIVDGTPVQLKLSILQVWKWKHRHYVLVARQSVKI